MLSCQWTDVLTSSSHNERMADVEPICCWCRNQGPTKSAPCATLCVLLTYRRDAMARTLMAELESLQSRCDLLATSKEEQSQEAEKTISRVKEVHYGQSDSAREGSDRRCRVLDLGIFPSKYSRVDSPLSPGSLQLIKASDIPVESCTDSDTGYPNPQFPRNCAQAPNVPYLPCGLTLLCDLVVRLLPYGWRKVGFDSRCVGHFLRNCLTTIESRST